MTVSVFAPAKINLTLHVTGRRSDGYHELDSLVVFAPIGDSLRIRKSNTMSLTVSGPEASGVPTDASNLALRAAELAGAGQPVEILLEKNLPTASGIGGGSADAAAAWRGMEQLCGAKRALSGKSKMLAIGADVPMCYLSRPMRARGVCEILTEINLPPLSALLVNPRVPVATPAVFGALMTSSISPMREAIPSFATTRDLIDWLVRCRNDLEVPATTIAPVVTEVLNFLSSLEGSRLARMSGSGASCYALFDDLNAAKKVEAAAKTAHPNWWVKACQLGDMSQMSRPVAI